MIDSDHTRVRSAVRSAALLVGCVVAIAAVGVFDRRVGGEITLSVFYVVPVALAAWLFGPRAGLPMAAFAIALWSVAEFTNLDQSFASPVPWWNAGVRLAFFVGVVIVVSALRSALVSERLLARRDAATGVANARQFMERADQEARRLRRIGAPLCIAFCDVDNLKTVNDEYGHVVGDALLELVAETLHNGLRRTDLVARLGGDEFGALLPDTDENAACAALGKARNAVNMAIAEAGWPATLSIGAVSTHLPVHDVRSLLNKADANLYKIKHAGRDGLLVGTISDGTESPPRGAGSGAESKEKGTL